MATAEVVTRLAARLRSRAPRVNGMVVLTVVVLTSLGYLLVVPVGLQIFTSFRGPVTSLPFESTAVFTFNNFSSLFANGRIFETIWDTGVFVVGSVSLSLMFGLTMAWLIERTNLPGRSIWLILLITPAIIPPLIMGQAWLSLLSPNTGIVNQMIRFVLPFWDSGPINPFSFPGMIIVQGIQGIPFFFLLLIPVFRNMDGALEEASRTSGATAARTFRKVTVPLAMPGVMAITMLWFIIVLGQFEIPLLFGTAARANIFSLGIWHALLPPDQGLPRYGEAAAFGVIFLLIAYGLFFFYSRVNRQANKYATVTGKGYRPIRMGLGLWKYPAMAFIVFYFVLAFVLPLFILTWDSLSRYISPVSWSNIDMLTTHNYAVIWGDDQFWGGLRRSFLVAGLSATIAVGLAMAAAWIVVRGRRSIWTRALDLLTSSSVAIPSAVAALALLTFYLQVNRFIPLFGTVWILVLAYAFRTSTAYRTSYAGILQINSELEEASAVSGGTPMSTLRRIVWPLLRPHVAAAWLLLFLLGTHEFTIALFLSTGESATLPVVLFNRMAAGRSPSGGPVEAATMAVLYTLAMMVVVGLIVALTMRRTIREPDQGR